MTSSVLSVLFGLVSMVLVVYLMRNGSQLKRLQVRLPFGVQFLIEAQPSEPKTAPKRQRAGSRWQQAQPVKDPCAGRLGLEREHV